MMNKSQALDKILYNWTDNFDKSIKYYTIWVAK